MRLALLPRVAMVLGHDRRGAGQHDCGALATGAHDHLAGPAAFDAAQPQSVCVKETKLDHLERMEKRDRIRFQREEERLLWNQIAGIVLLLLLVVLWVMEHR